MPDQTITTRPAYTPRPMTKREQAELTRKAKRLGQMLIWQEHDLSCMTDYGEIGRLNLAELEYLRQWVAYTIAKHGLLAVPGMWK